MSAHLWYHHGPLHENPIIEAFPATSAGNSLLVMMRAWRDDLPTCHWSPQAGVIPVD